MTISTTSIFRVLPRYVIQHLRTPFSNAYHLHHTVITLLCLHFDVLFLSTAPFTQAAVGVPEPYRPARRVQTQSEQVAQRRAEEDSRDERTRAHNTARGERLQEITTRSKNINGFGDEYVPQRKGPAQVSNNSTLEFADGGAGSVAPVVPSAGGAEANRRLMSGPARFYAKSNSPDRGRATRQYDSSVGYTSYEYSAASAAADVPTAAVSGPPAAGLTSAAVHARGPANAAAGSGFGSGAGAGAGPSGLSTSGRFSAAAAAQSRPSGGFMQYNESGVSDQPVSARRRGVGAGAGYTGNGNILSHPEAVRSNGGGDVPAAKAAAAPYATGDAVKQPSNKVYSGIQRPY